MTPLSRTTTGSRRNSFSGTWSIKRSLGSSTHQRSLHQGSCTRDRQRLRVDDRERAETVMRFGISDRPALVLAVEGHAEYEIAPRVLEMLGYDPAASRIEVVNMEGINGDVKLLARARGCPTSGHRRRSLLHPLLPADIVDGRRGSRAAV